MAGTYGAPWMSPVALLSNGRTLRVRRALTHNRVALRPTLGYGVRKRFLLRPTHESQRPHMETKCIGNTGHLARTSKSRCKTRGRTFQAKAGFSNCQGEEYSDAETRVSEALSHPHSSNSGSPLRSEGQEGVPRKGLHRERGSTGLQGMCNLCPALELTVVQKLAPYSIRGSPHMEKGTLRLHSGYA